MNVGDATTPNNRTRVVVTGAGGFVGPYVISRLLWSGYRVAALSRGPLAMRHPHLQHVAVSDLRALPEWQDHLSGARCLVQLAGRAHHFDAPGADTEELYRRANAGLTELLYTAARTAGVERFIYISSIKVTGERTLARPVVAGDPSCPEDAYARSKLEAECRLRQLAAEGPPQLVIIRPPLVFGPGVGANFLRLVRLAHTRMPVPFGGLSNKRSLVSAWNLADLIAVCVEHPAAASQVLLVADSPAISPAELIGMLRKQMHRRGTVFRVPLPLLKLIGRCAGMSGSLAKIVDSLEVDDSATRVQLDWRPRFTLEEGIARTAAWFQAEKAGRVGQLDWMG